MDTSSDLSHNFELAAARGALDSLSTDGSVLQGSAPVRVRVSRLLYSGFIVNVGDVEDFLAGETLSEAFLQLLLMLSRSVWNSNTYVYPPWLVPHRKVSATLKRFVPGGGSKVQSLPAVACFPYLLPTPRTWVLYVVRADHDCPSKKSVTVVAPPALDLLALSFATTHLRSVFVFRLAPRH